MTQQPTILVVGSINMDLVVRAPRMPAPGETVLGEGFATAPGGKGANQAVAVARQGARCLFLGRIGEDAFGERLLAGMKEEGIDCENLLATPDVATGVAMIIVDANGENSIVVASGANYRVTPDDVYHRAELFDQADLVVLQLELPLPTVRAARKLAARHGCKVVLDPAPAPKVLPAELCEVDVITPNVSEAEIITGTGGEAAGPDSGPTGRSERGLHRLDEPPEAGRRPQPHDERVDKLVASDLIARGAKAAVLKLGQRGSMVMTADGQIASVRPYKVNIVDTTAGGDAFTGVLAVGIARGLSLPEAAKVANAAGALACTKFGAQPSMPTADEIKILMADQKP